MEKLRVCHLFSGVGAPEMALDRLGVEYENVGFSEIDKFAIQSYKAIHGDNITELGDIEKIEELPECDLLVYGSPCVCFSVAGKKEGLIDKDGNKTRSGLLLDVERLLETGKANDNLPKYLLMENVKNLVGKKFKPDFDRWLIKLNELGYTNYWKVLNAKDYGIPQNRERVFVISIRKDIDKVYNFPEPFLLQTRVKDILESNVDEKFYLNQHTIDKIAKSKYHSERDRVIKDNVCQTLRARDYKDPVCVKEPQIITEGNIYPNTGNPQAGRIYNAEGISPALDTCNGGNRMPKITEPCIGASRGRNPDNPSDRTIGAPTEQRLEINSRGLSNTLTTVAKDNYVVEPNEPIFRIRKLTPLECWRLMGFSDEDFYKAKNSGVSNSQLYKQAGNSIVVDVLYYIFKNLLDN